MVEKAKTEFSDSQSVHNAVREWKVSSFKSGSTAPLPPDLVEARREAIFAGEELEHAEAVASQMNTELEGAEAAFAAAERARTEAASSVVLEQMAGIAAEIEDLYQRRRHLREVLRGATSMPLTAQQNGVMQTLLNKSLNDPMIPGLAYPPVAPAAAAYWANFRSLLLADSAAELGAPPDKI